METYTKLPNAETFQKICKAIAVLDAIICPEWEYRYYSYNSKWDKDEEFFEMRNGGGEHMLILFKNGKCVINGVHTNYRNADKTVLTKSLPEIFNNFIFGEPVNTRGTNFCIWTNDDGNWVYNKTEDIDNGMEELLYIFDNNPKTYIDWAEEYFEDSCCEAGISEKTVQQLFNGETLTKNMVLSIVDEVDDWEQLKEDLAEIDYPHNLQ